MSHPTKKESIEFQDPMNRSYSDLSELSTMSFKHVEVEEELSEKIAREKSKDSEREQGKEQETTQEGH